MEKITKQVTDWVTVYKAYDGMEFATPREAMEHEDELRQIDDRAKTMKERFDNKFKSLGSFTILQKLSEAMRLGSLGEQIVLKSEAAFGRISYLSCEAAEAAIYFAKKKQRDLDARREYSAKRSKEAMLDEIYMIDIMRGRVSDDELFL